MDNVKTNEYKYKYKTITSKLCKGFTFVASWDI